MKILKQTPGNFKIRTDKDILVLKEDEYSVRGLTSCENNTIKLKITNNEAVKFLTKMSNKFGIDSVFYISFKNVSMPCICWMVGINMFMFSITEEDMEEE